jgi:enamine deaminase RidA (YjgF/YER057c/UK114 family)
MSAEKKIQELHLILPPPPKAVAVYKPAIQIGNILYVSGHGPLTPEGQVGICGKVGGDLSLEQGQLAARQVALAILSTIRNTLGSLDKIKRLLKSLGMVNAVPDFKDHPKVINGYSELMAEVFGKDAGIGTRSAVGMGSLPNNIAVEIECQFEVVV